MDVPIFDLWTPWAVLVAALSGVAMAQVIVHLRADADTRLTSYLIFVLGAIWYVPIIVQRTFDAQALDAAEWRTVGTFLLFELCFATPAAFALAVHRRRHP